MPSRRNMRILQGLLDMGNDGAHHAGEKIFMPDPVQAAEDVAAAEEITQLRTPEKLKNFVDVDGFPDQRFPYVKKQHVVAGGEPTNLQNGEDLVIGMASLADHDRVKYGAENMDEIRRSLLARYEGRELNPVDLPSRVMDRYDIPVGVRTPGIELLGDPFTDNRSLETLDLSDRFVPDQMAIDDTERYVKGLKDVVRGLDENVTSHEFNHDHEGFFDYDRTEPMRADDGDYLGDEPATRDWFSDLPQYEDLVDVSDIDDDYLRDAIKFDLSEKYPDAQLADDELSHILHGAEFNELKTLMRDLKYSTYYGQRGGFDGVQHMSPRRKRPSIDLGRDRQMAMEERDFGQMMHDAMTSVLNKPGSQVMEMSPQTSRTRQVQDALDEFGINESVSDREGYYNILRRIASVYHMMDEPRKARMAKLFAMMGISPVIMAGQGEQDGY